MQVINGGKEFPCYTLTPTAPVLNNSKSIDYFNELSNQFHPLSQQTIISQRERKKKKRWYQRKEKAMNKKKKRKRKNSHQHSFLCFPCKPLSLLFQPHSSVVSEILISWTLSVLAVLSSPILDNTTSVRNILLICISSSLIRNTPAILSKYTSKVISLLSFIFFFFFSQQINIIGFMKLFSNQFLPNKFCFTVSSTKLRRRFYFFSGSSV